MAAIAGSVACANNLTNVDLYFPARVSRASVGGVYGDGGCVHAS